MKAENETKSFGKKERKELAMILYVRGGVENQRELAERIGVSEQTIVTWKKEGRWDDFKKSLLVTRQEELRRLYDQLKEVNDSIMAKEIGQRFANNKEADIITKLTGAIRQLETETSAAQVIDVAMKFNEYLRKIDLGKAKEMAELMDGFIKSMI